MTYHHLGAQHPEEDAFQHPDNAGVELLERAAATARDYAPLPEFTDALLGLIGKAVLGLIGGPISDQHELLLTIARLARRK